MTDNRQDKTYDIFLSHASPDKPWVREVEKELKKLGLRVFLDELEIDAADNWVIRLSDGLQNSRYFALFLSNHTEGRYWVEQEWTNWLAAFGALERLLPIKIDNVNPPFILNATQAITAIDRDAEKLALEIFAKIGDPSKMTAEDKRRLILGRDLVISLARNEDNLIVNASYGEQKTIPLPWKTDRQFGISHLEFTKLQKEPMIEDRDRADLRRHAITLGTSLFDILFTEQEAENLIKMIGPDRRRPIIHLRSDDSLLHAIPWELVCHNETFLIREGLVDLIRSTNKEINSSTLLREPTDQFKLVVNVSAPENSGLSYEEESYRITLATEGRCETVPTELGTVTDLINTVKTEKPKGIHFSGHGLPGALAFEDNLGQNDIVKISDLITRLQQAIPDSQTFPPFFYLASCHGNEPADINAEDEGSFSAAIQLHQAGVTQVVGYYGPILDELSTRAEETLYEAIAEGYTTRDAVRMARQELTKPFYNPEGKSRPSISRSARSSSAAAAAQSMPNPDTHPFAWAQLVFYHRGPEWPLSIETTAAQRTRARTLQRTYQGFGTRKTLKTGFIGRRNELHKIRRRLKQGDKVFVFQGLGGLGKSTLSQYILPMLTKDENAILTFWCQEIETAPNKAEALVAQLLDYCRKRFGLEWEGVVQQVDHMAGENSAQRFLFFLQVLLQNAELVLNMDNLESLLIGPDDANPESFGDWAEPELQAIWVNMLEFAKAAPNFHLIASCRYRNKDFGDYLLPVTPLPADALFRLTDWFPALQKLSPHARARLVGRLDGHPRAVEYANDLINNQLVTYRNRHGEWSIPPQPSAEDLTREWQTLIAPALPQVEEKLKDNLLLQAIWTNVLNEDARQFLYRMTVLRAPVDWETLLILGNTNASPEETETIAETLRDTSLLEQTEILQQTDTGTTTITEYLLHPATGKFIRDSHPENKNLLIETHKHLGNYLEQQAQTSPYIKTHIEAGHHLFQAEEYDRSYELLGRVSKWLIDRGRVRECIHLLQPFLQDTSLDKISFFAKGQLFNYFGTAYMNLGEMEKAIGYFKQALIVAKQNGVKQGEGSTLGNLGTAYSDLGEVEKAIGTYEQALVIAREIGDRRNEGNALGSLGIAYSDLGEVEKGIGYYEQALVIAREIGDRRNEGNWLGNLGTAYRDLGEVEKAIGTYEQALVIAREIGDRRNEGNALGSLGTAYSDLGEVEKAIGTYEQALVIAREIGDRRNEGNALGSLGTAYSDLGEVEKAIGTYEQALVIAREIGDRRNEGNWLGNLGTAYSDLGEVEKAIGYYEQARTIGEEIKDPRIVEFATSNLEKLKT